MTIQTGLLLSGVEPVRSRREHECACSSYAFTEVRGLCDTFLPNSLYCYFIYLFFLIKLIHQLTGSRKHVPSYFISPLEKTRWPRAEAQPFVNFPIAQKAEVAEGSGQREDKGMWF
jgi:hypothetical protein